MFPILLIGAIAAAIGYALGQEQRKAAEARTNSSGPLRLTAIGYAPDEGQAPYRGPVQVLPSSPLREVDEIRRAIKTRRPLPASPAARAVSVVAADDAAASAGPPLSPAATRLLALLVLFARDKKFPPGQKAFLSPNTALEAVRLARHLGLHKTAMAVRKDGAIPDNEFLPGRTVSIRKSVYLYGTTGKA